MVASALTPLRPAPPVPHPHAVKRVDSQLQQLRARQSFMYWRERSHRSTVESTHKRVLWFSILRSIVLVLVGVGQVVGVRMLFLKRGFAQSPSYGGGGGGYF